MILSFLRALKTPFPFPLFSFYAATINITGVIPVVTAISDLLTRNKRELNNIDNGSSGVCRMAARILNLSSFSCSNWGPNPVVFFVFSVSWSRDQPLAENSFSAMGYLKI